MSGPPGSFTSVDKLGGAFHTLHTIVNPGALEWGIEVAKSIQILLRNAHSTVDAAVRSSLTDNGFADILPWHFAVLRNLGEDGARPSELAARAGITRQAITKLVGELERLGLVYREPDPRDGRGLIVRYTDRGRAGLDIARRQLLALERSYAAQVGPDRWAEVRATLEVLFDHEPPTT